MSAYACFCTFREMEVSKYVTVDTVLVPPLPNELGSSMVDPQHPDWSQEPQEAIEHVEWGSSALRWAVTCKRHPGFWRLSEKRNVKYLAGTAV